MRASDRIVAYDALRVLAIVTVVAIHTLIPYRSLLPPNAPIRVLDDMLHYAVPLFVFISGVFVWSRPIGGNAGSYRQFIGRRAAIIGVPYLAWFALYFALFAINTAETIAPSRALGLLLTGHVWYHLYFIPMLLTFYLLTPIARRGIEFSPEAFVLACYAVRILAGPSIAEAFQGLFGDLGWSYATHIVTHLPHMALGAWFALRAEYVPKRRWIALVLLAYGTAILLAANLGMLSGLAPLLRRVLVADAMAATVLGLAIGALTAESLFERVRLPVLVAGQLAFGVYFVHPLFLLVVDRAVGENASLWLQPWLPLTAFLLVTGASFATSELLVRLPVACRLVGVASPVPARND